MRAAPNLIDELLDSDLVDDPERSCEAEPQRAKATARRRRRWGEQAWLAAITLGSVGGFLALARAINGKRGNALDQAVVERVGRARHPVGDALMRGVTFFGGVTGGTTVSLTALSLARRRPRLAWQVVIGALGGTSAELGWKHLFRRKRPRLLAHLEDVHSTSFPSGHAMASASLYLTLAFVASRSRRLQKHRAGLIAGAGALAGAVGASRVYLGVHWPTDVIGGLLLGTAWACLTEAGFDLTGAEQVEREMEVVAPTHS
jgi:undecaprenyl-diphosphatase